MSEVGTDPVLEPELPLEQPAEAPDQPIEETPAPAEGEQVDAAPEVKPEPKATPPLPKGIADRFKELSEARDRANAERDLYKSMVNAQPKAEEGDGQVRQQTPQNIEALVRAEAVKLVAHQELQRKTQSFFKEGREAFPDFDDRCALIDGLGATDRQEFVQMVTDLPNGAKIVAALADEPDEARRILSLSTTSMALELAKKGLSMASQPNKTPISKAPAPARPLQGAARASEDLQDEDTDAAWFAKREKQLAAKRATR